MGRRAGLPYFYATRVGYICEGCKMRCRYYISTRAQCRRLARVSLPASFYFSFSSSKCQVAPGHPLTPPTSQRASLLPYSGAAYFDAAIFHTLGQEAAKSANNSVSL